MQIKRKSYDLDSEEEESQVPIKTNAIKKELGDSSAQY